MTAPRHSALGGSELAGPEVAGPEVQGPGRAAAQPEGPEPAAPGLRAPGLIRQVLTASGLFFAAQILAKLLNFVFFLLLARWLEVAEFGLLSYAIAAALIVDIAADAGMTRLLLRDVSRRPGLASRRLALFWPLKAALGCGLYALAMGLVLAGRPEPPGPAVFGVVGLCVLFTGATLLAEQVLHSRGRFGWAATAHLTLALTQIGGAALAQALGGGVLAMALMLVLANIAYLAVILTGLHRAGVVLRLRVRPRLWRAVLRRSAPFAAVGILILLALKVEFLVLGAQADADALGRFGAASRLFDAAMIAPLTLCAVLTPRFIEQQARSTAALTHLYAQGARAMLIVTGGLAVLGIALSADVVRLLLPPGYARAPGVLVCMFLALPPLSLHLLNVALMLGARTQRHPALLLVALTLAQAVVAWALTRAAAVPEQAAAQAMLVSAAGAALASSVAVRRWLLDAPVLARAALPPLLGLACVAGLAAGLGGLSGVGQALAATVLFGAATAAGLPLARLGEARL